MVLDASALVELILGTLAGRLVAARIADPAEALHVPHLADLEVTQALRHYARVGEIEVESATLALEDYRALDLRRHPHEPLLGRVWEMRDYLTAYDAIYLALAEALDTVLLTCDGALHRASRLAGRVVLISAARPGR